MRKIFHQTFKKILRQSGRVHRFVKSLFREAGRKLRAGLKVLPEYGMLIVIVAAFPAMLLLGAEAAPDGFRPVYLFEKPGSAAVMSDIGPGGGEDGVRHIDTPEAVKGIYITSATVEYKKRMVELTDFVERTELNAMVIDVKNARGEIAFSPESEELKPYADEYPELGDLKELTGPLHEKGIYLIARVFVFQDPAYAEARPELAVQNSWGGTWRDWRGIPWLDPAAVEVWKYNVAVAREAYAGGFDEIQFDYIRFPSDGDMRSIAYPVYDGEKSKSEVMRGFFVYLDRELRVKGGIPISVDLFGLTMWMHDNDMNIGQLLRDAAPHFDFVSPMVYPSHYPPAWQGMENPAAYPYRVVYDNIVKGRELLDRMREEERAKAAENPGFVPGKICEIRPWLQDFDLGAVYTAEMVRDQIRATREGGGTGWLFWNARNVYTEHAFLPAEPFDPSTGSGSP